MRVTHKFVAICRCPVDDCPDVYEVIIRTDRVVMVEEILKAKRTLETGGPITQEGFTVALAGALQCEVETKGAHSGVETTCVHGDAT